MPDADDIVQEVKNFYQNFLDGFNQGDTGLYLRSFCYPNTILSPEQGLIINAQVADQQGFYHSVRDDISARGWDHTGVAHMQAWPLAEEMALFVADLARYKKDGSVIEQGRYCYTLRKEDGNWKILTLAEVKPPFTGPGGA